MIVKKNSIEALLLRRCDALIIHSKALSDEELIEINNSTDIPLVFVNRVVPTLEDQCVWVDIASGIETAVNYLVKNGHKRIAYISSDENSFPDAVDRMNGYLAGLKQANIDYDNDLVSPAYPDENGGYQAVEALLNKKVDFSAFVAYNDAMALGGLGLLLEKDVAVPSKISAIGYDDNPICNYIKPKLTTVRYPIERVGERAARLALEMLAPRTEDNPLVIDRKTLKFTPELVERDSVSEFKAK